jgi:PKD repeat protein
MIYNYLKNLGCILLVCAGLSVKSQTAYSENFGTGNTFPGAWTLAQSDWIVDPGVSNGGGVPDCNVAGSSGQSLMAGAAGSAGTWYSTSEPFSTIGFTNMLLKWNGYRSTGAPALTVEMSSDNVTFTPLSFTDVTTDDAWHALTPIAVPAAFENKTTVYIRWSYTAVGSGNFLGFDDIDVSGTPSPVYYWDGVGALNQFTSWWSNPNATGTNPASFTFNNQVFNLFPNATSATAVTLGSAWTVGGTGTKVNVGDGTTGFNFNLGAVLTIFSGGKLVVLNTSTVTIANTTFPATGDVTLNSGSTVDYAQANSTMWALTHSHLTVSGGTDKTQPGNLVINGDLNLNGTNLTMSNSSLISLTINGQILGSGVIKTGNSKLNIGGSGAFGTITFGTGSTVKTVNQFNVNRGSTGSVVLGSDLTVNSTSNLQNGTINIAGKNLTLNGAITFPATSANGSFIPSITTSLNIGGAGSITNNLLFSGSTSMANIILNRAGATLNLGSAVDIYGDITPTAGTIASGSNLTLKSDASHKGRIGQIGASGGFTGSPTVELYKSAGLTGWVNLCSSGVTGNSISNWNSAFAITCSSGCPDGTGVSNVAFTSMYTYDQSTFSGDDADASHYIDIGTTGGTGQSLNSKVGYWVYLGNGFPNTSSIMINLTGGVNTKASSGAIALSNSFGASATDGWNLIANPYPSPISVANILNAIGSASANIDNTFYAYDPDAATNSPMTIIPMGQAFSVRSLVGSVNLTPDETWKTSTNNNTEIFKTTSSSPMYWNDFMLNLTSSTFTTGFTAQSYFTFGNTNTNGFDNGKDAYYLANSVDIGYPEMFSTTGSDKFLRNALPMPSGLVTIPLTIRTGTAFAGVYQITPANLNKLPAGACVVLYDIANNVSHNLKSGAYTATIAANATTPQFELRITLNPATMTSSMNNPMCSKINNGSIIAKGSSTGPWDYTWKDASDNIIKTTSNVSVPDTLKNLGMGTYKVDIGTVSTCNNASQTFNMISTAALPVSAFSVNKDTLYIGGSTQFIFTNNSTNSNTYSWNFGDGNTSNLANPTYMYGTAGDYKVSLTAINSACGDSSNYNYYVHAVNTPTLSGINALAGTDNNIKIGKDSKGLFVQMNYDKNTQATVTISNVLGQTLMSPRIIEGDTEKFYFDVNAKDQLLLITVTTSEKRITQRVFNN